MCTADSRPFDSLSGWNEILDELGNGSSQESCRVPLRGYSTGKGIGYKPAIPGEDEKYGLAGRSGGYDEGGPEPRLGIQPGPFG